MRWVLLFTTVAAVLVSGVVVAQAATYTYELNGNLNEASGGPSLVAQGGSIGATGYTFGPNQGLDLGLSNLTEYSITLTFSLDDVPNYNKIIDFKDQSADSGLYILNGALNFYPVTTGSSAIASNAVATVTLTRTAAGLLEGYLNNALQFSFQDTSSLAVSLTSLQFFQDDTTTSSGEASGGFVDRIVISSPSIVSNPTAVPGPIAGAGLPALLALGGFVWARRRKAAAVA